MKTFILNVGWIQYAICTEVPASYNHLRAYCTVLSCNFHLKRTN